MAGNATTVLFGLSQLGSLTLKSADGVPIVYAPMGARLEGTNRATISVPMYCIPALLLTFRSFRRAARIPRVGQPLALRLSKPVPYDSKY